MTHCMNLELSAFLKIANGSKTIELRLNDKKRQKINIGDRIEFRCSEINSVIFAEVIKLHKFLDFEQLYKALPLEKCGYSKNDLKSAHYTDMEKYYIKEQIKKYGVLGIELQKITAIVDVKASLFDYEILALYGTERLWSHAGEIKMQGRKILGGQKYFCVCLQN